MKTLLLFSIALLVASISNAQNKNFIDLPYIEVNGTSDSLVTPNEIFIKITISEKDSRDKVSVEEQEIKMVNVLKEIGINTETSLTASDMMSNYRYHLIKSKDIIKTKQYILKVSDAVAASKVFIKLEELGISNTSIDRVTHSNLESIKNLMRIKAVENAKARATALTKPLGQNVGQAIHISDIEVQQVNGMLQGRAPGVVITGYGMKKQATEELPKIEFEKIKVISDVQIKFALK